MTRVVADAAQGGGGEALRYFIAQKYVEAVGELAGNPSGRTLVVPLETGALAGGIAQAVEMMRFGPKADEGARRRENGGTAQAPADRAPGGTGGSPWG